MKKFPMVFCALAAAAMIASCAPRQTIVTCEKPTLRDVTYKFIEKFTYDEQSGAAEFTSINLSSVTEKDGKYVVDFSAYEKVMFLVVFSAGFDTLEDTKCTLGNTVMTEKKYQKSNPQYYLYEAEAPKGNVDLVFTARIQESTL